MRVIIETPFELFWLLIGIMPADSRNFVIPVKLVLDLIGERNQVFSKA